jgi:sec-independent protein translocase protein TatA
MFGLGVPELIFIFLLALLIFGPKKLPEIGRTLGKGMAEFRKASNELTRTLNAEIALDENPVPPVVRSQRMDALREARSTSAVTEAGEVAALHAAPAPDAPAPATSEAQEPAAAEPPATPLEPS